MHPQLLHLGSFVLPTYSVFAALGVVCAFAAAQSLAPNSGLTADGAWRLCLGTLLGTVALSRIVLLAQAWSAFVRYPLIVLALPTLTRFSLLLGAAAFLASVWFWGIPLLRALDAIIVPACLLAVFLHVGSIFAGDDLGARTSLAVGRLIPGDHGHHPVALYAGCMAALASLLTWDHLRSDHALGSVFGLGLLVLATSSFLTDEFRPSYVLGSGAVPVHGLLTVPQLAQVALMLTGAALLLRRSSQLA